MLSVCLSSLMRWPQTVASKAAMGSVLAAPVVAGAAEGETRAGKTPRKSSTNGASGASDGGRKRGDEAGRRKNF